MGDPTGGVSQQPQVHGTPELTPHKESEHLDNKFNKEIPESDSNQHEQKYLSEWDISIAPGIKRTCSDLTKQLADIDQDMAHEKSPDSTRINNIVSDNSEKAILTINNALNSLPGKPVTRVASKADQAFKSLFTRLGRIHEDAKKTPGLFDMGRKKNKATARLHDLKVAIQDTLDKVLPLLDQSNSQIHTDEVSKSDQTDPLSNQTKTFFTDSANILAPDSESSQPLDKKQEIEEKDSVTLTIHETESNQPVVETNTIDVQKDKTINKKSTVNDSHHENIDEINEQIKKAKAQYLELITQNPTLDESTSENDKEIYQKALSAADSFWLDEIDNQEKDIQQTIEKLVNFQISLAALDQITQKIKSNKNAATPRLLNTTQKKDQKAPANLSAIKPKRFNNQTLKHLASELNNTKITDKEHILERIHIYTKQQAAILSEIAPALQCLDQWAESNKNPTNNMLSYRQLLKGLEQEEKLNINDPQLVKKLEFLDTKLCKIAELMERNGGRSLLCENLPGNAKSQDHLIQLLLKSLTTEDKWPPREDTLNYFNKMANYISSYSSNNIDLSSSSSKYHGFIEIAKELLNSHKKIEDMGSQITSFDEASALASGICEYTWFKGDQKMLHSQRTNNKELKEFGYSDIEGGIEIEQAADALERLKNISSKEKTEEVKQKKRGIGLDEAWKTISDSVLTDVKSSVFDSASAQAKQLGHEIKSKIGGLLKKSPDNEEKYFNTAVKNINKILEGYAEVKIIGEGDEERIEIYRTQKSEDEEELALHTVLQRISEKQLPAASHFKKTHKALLEKGLIRVEKEKTTFTPYSTSDIERQASDILNATKALSIGVKSCHRTKSKTEEKYKTLEAEKSITLETIKENKKTASEISKLITSEKERATTAYKKELEQKNKGIKAYVIKKIQTALAWFGFINKQEKQENNRTMSEHDEKKITQLESLKKHVQRLTREPHPYKRDSLSQIEEGLTSSYLKTLNMLQEASITQDQANSILSPIFEALKLTEKNHNITSPDEQHMTPYSIEYLANNIKDHREKLISDHKKLTNKWYKSKETKKILADLSNDIHILEKTEELLLTHKNLSGDILEKTIKLLKKNTKQEETKHFISTFLRQEKSNYEEHHMQDTTPLNKTKEAIELRLNKISGNPTPVEEELKHLILDKMYSRPSKCDDGFSALYHEDQHRGTELIIEDSNGECVFDSEKLRADLEKPELGMSNTEVSESVQAEKKKFLRKLCEGHPKGTLPWLSDYVTQKLATPIVDIQVSHLQKTLSDDNCLVAPLNRKLKISITPPSPNSKPLQDIKVQVHVSYDSYQLITDMDKPENTKTYLVNQPVSGVIEATIDPEFPDSPILNNISFNWGTATVNEPEIKKNQQQEKNKTNKDAGMTADLKQLITQSKEVLEIHGLFENSDHESLELKKDLQQEITKSEQIIEEFNNAKDTDNKSSLNINIMRQITAVLSRKNKLELAIKQKDMSLGEQQAPLSTCQNITKFCTLALSRDQYIRSAIKATQLNDPALCDELTSHFGESTSPDHETGPSVATIKKMQQDIYDHQITIGNILQAIEGSFNDHIEQIITNKADNNLTGKIKKTFLSKEKKEEYNYNRAKKVISDFKDSFLSTYFDIDDGSMKISIKKQKLTEREAQKLNRHKKQKTTSDIEKSIKNASIIKQLEHMPVEGIDTGHFIALMKEEAKQKTKIQNQLKDYLSQLPGAWPDKFSSAQNPDDPFSVSIKDGSIERNLAVSLASQQKEVIEKLWRSKLLCKKIDSFKENQPIIVKLKEREGLRQGLIKKLSDIRDQVKNKKRINKKEEKLTLITQAEQAICSVETGEPQFGTKIKNIIRQLSGDYEETLFVLNLTSVPKILEQIWQLEPKKNYDSETYLELPEADHIDDTLSDSGSYDSGVSDLDDSSSLSSEDLDDNSSLSSTEDYGRQTTELSVENQTELLNLFNQRAGIHVAEDNNSYQMLHDNIHNPLDIGDDGFVEPFYNDFNRGTHLVIRDNTGTSLFDTDERKEKLAYTEDISEDDDIDRILLEETTANIKAICSDLPKETLATLSNCISQHMFTPLQVSLLESVKNAGQTITLPDLKRTTSITPIYNNPGQTKPSLIQVEAILESKQPVFEHSDGFAYQVDQPIEAKVTILLNPETPEKHQIRPIIHRFGDATGCRLDPRQR